VAISSVGLACTGGSIATPLARIALCVRLSWRKINSSLSMEEGEAIAGSIHQIHAGNR
jgi:hypothetical protein